MYLSLLCISYSMSFLIITIILFSNCKDTHNFWISKNKKSEVSKENSTLCVNKLNSLYHLLLLSPKFYSLLLPI